MNIPVIKALVPMKGHSERVPHKNIRPLVGKPCFHWVMEALSDSKYITEIIVDTDSAEIAGNAKSNFEKITIVDRPEFLFGDMVTIQPLIAYDITQTSGDYFLQTHSTNPLLTTATIDKAIETFFSQTEHDALFSVTEIKQRFYWKDGSGVNHDPRVLIRTQDLDPIFHENSCFYIFSRETNVKTQSRLGSNPLMFSMDRLEAADIDDMEDFYWAEFLLKRRIAQHEK